MNHLCFTASWKNSANGEWAGRGSQRRTTFPLGARNKSPNSQSARPAFYLEAQG